MVSVGDKAPAFTLPDSNGDAVSLDDFEGTRLLVFIPNPFTGICDDEGCAIRDNLAQLNDLGAQVIVVTVHGKAVTKKWAEENGFSFPVLSDYWPHGATTQAYGAFNDEVGVANRYSFVIDGDGVIREVISTEALGIGREYDAYVEALGKL
jgi:peroxiredoxin